MSNLRVSRFEGRPLLDIASYARKGPGRRDHLSLGEVAQLSRTVRRAPEVVVKVLSKNANNLSAIARHVGYIGRCGDLALETEDGERLSGKGIGRQLLQDWDLDLEEHRGRSDLIATRRSVSPKLVHKLIFSMPPGTPPGAVLAATRNFLREQFALKHRYAFVLHTDEPHPHVHAVVKAVSEQGVRLNIRKATLREWRHEFARQLRQRGVEANATDRSVRGESRTPKLDGIYRTAHRGESIHMRSRAEIVARELSRKNLRVEAGKSDLMRTREEVMRGWSAARDILVKAGERELASEINRFLERMRPPKTDKESIAQMLLHHVSTPVDRRPRFPGLHTR